MVRGCCDRRIIKSQHYNLIITLKGNGRMFLIDLVVGARPNFMKAAPVFEALRMRRPDWRVRLIHTGQHYDERMSELFFRQLSMPKPDVNLEIGSASQGIQTARIMVALEKWFTRDRPNLVFVFGDVNSTLAGSLIASKMQIPLAHVEAGLRSFDRTMPEEVNRVLTDAVSDWLFTTEPDAEVNLRREGIAPERICFVGNTMIDTLLKHLPHALALHMPDRYEVIPKRYAVVTLHRPGNVDNPSVLHRILQGLTEIASEIPLLFPVHPRTRQRLEGLVISNSNLRIFEPMGYLEFIGLMASAVVVLTDSGGIQEETTILGVPCVTLRGNTERPITVKAGTNILVGDDPQRMVAEALRALNGKGKEPQMILEKWDGKAASRIVDCIESHMQ